MKRLFIFLLAASIPLLASSRVLREDTATQVAAGPFIDGTDFITPETALTVTAWDCGLIKHADSGMSATSITITATGGSNDAAHLDNGVYSLELTATDTNTAGRLKLICDHATPSTFLAVAHEWSVMPTQEYDSMYGTDVQQVDVSQWLGTAAATPTTAGVPEVDVTHWEGELVPEATGTGIPQVDIQYIEATAQTSVDLADFADAGYNPTTDKVQGVVLVDDITTKTGYTASPTAGSITDASLGGNLEIVFETDFATNYNITTNAWVTNFTDILGTHPVANLDTATGTLSDAQLDTITTTIGAGGIPVGAFASAAITADAIATNAIGDLELVDTALGEAPSNWATAVGFSTLTQTQVTGGAYTLDTDINGRIRIVDGTAAGEIDTNAGAVSSVTTAATCSALGAGAVNNTSTTLTETLNCDVVAGGIAAGDVATGGIEAGDFAANAITDAAVANDVQVDVLTIETGGAVAALNTAADTVTMTAATAAGVQDFFTVDSGETSASAVEGSVVKEAADGVSGGGLTAISTGTAQSATDTTIRLANAETFADDELIGAVVHVTGGTTGIGQTKCITDYTSSTDTATVTTWITTPSGIITYELVPSVGSLCPDTTATASTAIWAESTRTLTAIDEDTTTLDLNATTIGTVNTLTNHTAQTGDNFARLGVAGAGLTDLGGMSTGMLAEVESEVDDALVVRELDHLVNVADADDPADNSIIAKLAANDGDWSGFVTTTDSQEAIRDRGDTAWATGTGTGLTGVVGTTQTATHAATAIVLASGGVANDDDFLGWWLQITSGGCANQKAKVVSSARATDVVTVRPGLRIDGSGTCTNIDNDLDGVTYELAPYGG